MKLHILFALKFNANNMCSFIKKAMIKIQQTAVVAVIVDKINLA